MDTPTRNHIRLCADYLGRDLHRKQPHVVIWFFVVDENHLRVHAHAVDISKRNEDTSKKLNESWGYK